MERYRAVPQSEGVVCPLPAVAEGYREPVAAGAAAVQFQPLEPREGRHQPAAQINLAPEPDKQQPKAHPSTPAQILAKIRAPNAAGQKQLGQMLNRLRRPTPAETQSADDIEVDKAVVLLPTYPTAFGTYSFPELYERSRKYAAFVLHHSYHVQAADIEDGLQAGCMALWEGLQQEAEGLEDKTMAWMGMKVVYTALHATRGDWKYRQQTQAEGEGRSDSG